MIKLFNKNKDKTRRDLSKGWFLSEEFPNIFYKTIRKEYGIMIESFATNNPKELYLATIFHLPSCNYLFEENASSFIEALDKINNFLKNFGEKHDIT